MFPSSINGRLSTLIGPIKKIRYLKNILFITWDSGQTNYLESLFFPIFQGIQKEGYRFHIAQFSWASRSEVERIEHLAEIHEVAYFHFQVSRFPNALTGTLWSLIKSYPSLKKLISDHRIDIVLPRSTMPALLVNRLYAWIKANDLKLIFDADGFPLEERIDYSGLKSNSFQYRFLKANENRMIRRSDAVLTRSLKAIAHHLAGGDLQESRFFRVRNGRDNSLFRIDENLRRKLRAELNYSENDLVFIYTGSLGPAYAWDKTLEIFKYFLGKDKPVKMLVLTRDVSFLIGKLPIELLDLIQVLIVDFRQVPEYLNVGDLGISLRSPAPSLAGLFPIKLGEYLLTGLPVLASIQVGDSMDWITERKELIGINLDDPDFAALAYNDWQAMGSIDSVELRNWAMSNFSLNCAIEDYLVALKSLEN